MDKGQRTVAALLTVIAVLLGVLLVVTAEPAVRAAPEATVDQDGGPACEGVCCIGDSVCSVFDEDVLTCEAQGGILVSDCQSCFYSCCLPDGVCIALPPATCEGIVGGTANLGECASNRCLRSDCDSDLDGDSNVGFTDLNQVLAEWGECPTE